VSFGFRRLSIIDVANGQQPFKKDGKTIIFNGEIYNHNELRNELIKKGYKFETSSDTEVLLTLYIDKGEECVKYLRGMFAFLVWDEKENKVFGARDHFGIKPLYYTENEECIGFASEYKSLTDLVANKEVNEKSLQAYMSFQYPPEDETMFKGIKKILPGHCFTIKNNKLNIKKYYEIEYKPGNVTKEDVRKSIIESVEKHMMSEVAVGTFLSGGIDSSIMATIASKINPKIKSFSVGFGIDGYNELDVAAKTAEVLGIENIQVKVSQDEYIKALPQVIYNLDDPAADPSAIGIYFLSKEARKHVTVVLSGEGADELFGGYNIYKEYFSVKGIMNMPDVAKKPIKAMAEAMPKIKGKDFLLRATTPLRYRYIGNAKIFDNEESKKVLVNYKDNYEYQNILKKYYDEAKSRNYDYVSTMQYIDMNTWLPGDILLKGDKMSMASCIELRVPFLDKEVMKVSEQLQLEQKVSKEQSKILLREAFEDMVPEHVVQKRKLGFPTPIRVWLKDELGNVVRKTIKEAAVDHLVNKDYAISMLDEHIADKGDFSRKIWSIFVFCLWHQIFIENKNIEF
ncbi:MAG: asparagine synthase (glutamine-hydrolyzing), partial [Paraclostridium sp.]